MTILFITTLQKMCQWFLTRRSIEISHEGSILLVMSWFFRNVNEIYIIQSGLDAWLIYLQLVANIKCRVKIQFENNIEKLKCHVLSIVNELKFDNKLSA